MWRGETTGSFFLVFNAILNYDHLNAGASIAGPATIAVATGEDQEEY